MAAIKPAEVSAILKEQLTGTSTAASLSEVGTVLEVGDGIARVYGLTNAQYGELVTFESGLEAMVLNLEEDNVGVVLLGPSKEIKEGDSLRENTRATAAAWLACGLDTEKTIFYRQSDVCQTTELAWYLSCFFPYQRLTLAHSFKDKADRLSDVNTGLFTYPMLMAADILLYDADIVPVGKDQLQHLEMTRDVAARFNHSFGDVFVLPQAALQEETQYIPGIDGEKMSKSKKNTLNIFLPEKDLRKQVMKIQTDSTPMEAPKDPESCNVFALYRLLASDSETAALRWQYVAGGMGYGIDILAHKTAMESGLDTVACLPHALEMRLYPAAHENTANKMLQHGALVSDFLAEQGFEKGNFVQRNRLIAGLSQATIVIESGRKGGSLITAQFAQQYDRDVFAIPGSIQSEKSQGCHTLIQQNRAILLDSTEILLASLGWAKKGQVKQRQLPLELPANEQQVYELLLQQGRTSLDTLTQKLNWRIAETAVVLMQLEMKKLVRPLPAKYFAAV